MAHSQPPVPGDQQSDVIRGRSSPPDVKAQVKVDPAHDTSGDNLEERGDAANLAQNTTSRREQ